MKNFWCLGHHYAALGTSVPALCVRIGPIAKLPAILFLALSLASVVAHADDNALIRKGNAALAQKDYGTAFSIFSVLAQRGNPTAQYDVGVFYLNGLGVQKNEERAFYWLERSASLGNDRALQVVQNAAVNGNERAKSSYKRLVPFAADLPGARGVQAGADATTAATDAAPRQMDDPPSRFSVGVSGGQTRRITGISNSGSWGLLAGYAFNSSFGVEAAYNQLYRSADASGFVSARNFGATGTFDLSAVSLAGQYIYPLSSRWSVLGNLGFHTSRFRVKTPAADVKTGNSNGAVFGLKVQYDATSNVGIRGGFDTYTQSGGMTGTLTEVGVAVISRF